MLCLYALPGERVKPAGISHGATVFRLVRLKLECSEYEIECSFGLSAAENRHDAIVVLSPGNDPNLVTQDSLAAVLTTCRCDSAKN